MAQQCALAKGPPNYPRFADAFVVLSVMVLSTALGTLSFAQFELGFWVGTAAAFTNYAALLSLHLLIRRFIIVGEAAAGALVTPRLRPLRVNLRSPINSTKQFSFRTRFLGLQTRNDLVLACAASSLAGAYYLYRGNTIGSSDQLAGLIIFVSAAISSTVGFAFSALAGSMLFHVVPDAVHAVRLMLVASITIQAYSVWKLRQSISIRSLAPYFAGGLLTVVPGVYLLLNSSMRMYFFIMGAFLIVYGAYMVLQPPIRLRSNPLLARLVVGALGGMTGAIAAFPGAFITIWCGLHGWSKQQQRAIYQPYILGSQLMTLVVLAAATATETMHLELMEYSLPAIVGAYVGLRIFDRLSTGQFNKLVSAFLLLSGIVLAAKAF